MNFSKIKILCDEKRLTIPQLAEKVGISEAGLYQSFRTKSMKVDVLEKIVQVLEVPIWVFFDLDPESGIESLNKVISDYHYKVLAQDTINTALLKDVNDLTEKLKLATQAINAMQALIDHQNKMLSE
ncbi:MAG: helix-turn-helix transcriptional regulator [Bacteroidota bacterium]